MQLQSQQNNAQNRSVNMLMGAGRAVLTFKRIIEMIEARRMQREYEEKLEILHEGEVSGKLQNASLGTLEDAIALGLTEKGDHFIGAMEGRLLFWNGELGISAMGLTGSGKSTTLAIPTIINQGGRMSSVICDIKSELYYTTAIGRAELDGKDVIPINPFGLLDAGTVQVNPLQDLIDMAANGENINDRARAKTRMIFGDPEKQGANAWIQKGAMSRRFLPFLIWTAEEEPERCTLGHAFDFSISTIKETCDILSAMTLSEAGAGLVKRLAAQALEIYEADPETAAREHGWIHDNMGDTLELYAIGSPVRDFTSRTSVDLTLLKKCPQAVYVMIPDDYAISHGKFISLIFDYIIETVAKASGDIRVSFQIDEFANLPEMGVMKKALRLYRDRGIRITTYVQDRDGYDAYSTPTTKGYKMFEENTIGLLWGLRDNQHMKAVEERAGYYAVRVMAHNAGAGLLAGNSGASDSETLTPNLPVSTIGQICHGKAILEIPGEKTFIIDRVPWWEIEPWRNYIVDKNKYPMPNY